MNPSFTRFMLIGMCILMTTSTILQGQNVFWSENFSNGIPIDWTNYEVNNSLGEWKWDDDPAALIFFPQPPFAAATAQNGFVYFDSDAYNISHDARLISSSIDCSNQSTVIIHFENQYDYFTNSSQAILEVSKDSINWTVNNLFINHLPNNQRAHVQVVELDVSNVAANEPNVYLRFRWIGQDEYIWRIDDIRLQDIFSPPLANDIVIRDVAFAPNFRTPLAHVKDLILGGDIFNNGSETAYNVQLTTSIIDTVNNVLVYLDSANISSILSGGTATIGMPTDFLPSDEGKYKISYEVKSDSSDQARWDNRKIIPFEITTNIFQKSFEYSYLDSNAPGNNQYEIGNLYSIQDSGHYADKIYFTAARPLSTGPLMGSTVDLKLYEVSSTLNQFLDNINSSHVTPVAIGSYTFTAGDQNLANLVGVAIFDINGNRVLLKPNTRYLAMVAFTNLGNSNDIRIGLDDSWRYEFEISTVIFYQNAWYNRGFGAELTAIVLLQTTLSSHISETATTSIFDEKIKIYPNPVTKDNLTIQFDLDEMTDELTVSVSDITGKYLLSRIYKDIYKNEIKLNVKNYPKGVYFLTVTTRESKQIIKKIVVE